MKKKVISFLLVLVVMLGMLPVTGSVEVAEAASTGLNLVQLREKFPHGKYWNHAGSSSNNADGYTSTPCTHHDNCSYTGSCGCNSFLGLSAQCMGYAEKLGYDATGYNPRNNANGWNTYTSSSALNNLKPGDIVRFQNGSYPHSIYVIGVSGDSVTFTDCNSDGHCIIRWDVTISKSKLASNFIHLRSAPEEVSSNSIISKTYSSYCQIKATADTTIMTQPCSNGTDASSTKIESVSKGKTLTAYELVLNRVGNLWYKVKASDGTTGYIPSAKVSWVKDYTSDIKITGAGNPPDQEVGDAYWMQGTVSSTYSDLTDVSVYVYAGSATSGTAKIGAKGSVSGNSYPLNRSYVDNNTLFNKLTEGDYTFVVRGYYKNYYAVDEKTAGYHTGEVIVQTAKFSVVEENVLDSLPSQPVVSGMKSSYTVGEEIVFKWNSTTNTTHYNIWLAKKNSNGEYVKDEHITYVKSGHSITRGAGEYRAEVQAYNSNAWWPDGSDWLYNESEWVYFTVKLATPSVSISTTKSCGNPKLTWTAVTGAEKYEVYRATSSNGTYTKLKTTTALNYTDNSSRSIGTTYYYKVRAVEGSNYSSYSGVKNHTYTHTDIVTVSGKAATCTTSGLTDGKKCSVCGTVTVAQKTIAAKGHTEVAVPGKAATCTKSGKTDGKKCSVCGTVTVKQKTIAAKGHTYVDGVCTVCGAKDPNYVAGLTGVTRIFGADRYETAFKTAEVLKQQLGVEKFDNIVVACGDNFADALGGSYLAAKKNAPILLVKSSKIDAVKSYIKANLNPGGTVYLLGGTAAIPAAMDKGLDGFTVRRLAGATRYDTNLLILEEAGVTNEDILICTGKSFADSLSAAAAGRPILLVKDSLNDSQKAFLQAHSANKKYILGGTAAVSTRVENQVKAYGEVKRIGGNTRYETSVMIAKEFFPNAKQAALAYAQNFPDGLSGGALAYAMKAPLVLTASGKESAAAAYAKEQGITSGVILGGSGLISDKAVRTIFQMKSGDAIQIG